MWFFFCKQRTAYEMRIRYWSSGVCSSDLCGRLFLRLVRPALYCLAICPDLSGGERRGALPDGHLGGRAHRRVRLCQFLPAHDICGCAGHHTLLVDDARRVNRSLSRQRRDREWRWTNHLKTRRLLTYIVQEPSVPGPSYFSSAASCPSWHPYAAYEIG